jgi:hypothetical protein
LEKIVLDNNIKTTYNRLSITEEPQ